MKTLAERFWPKVRKTDTCWIWEACVGRDGYGKIGSGGRGGHTLAAHRVAYELLIGPIPANLDLDHVKARGCAYRHCVNPAHLEPVTRQENLLRGDTLPAANARKTHCPKGHSYDEANTYRRRGTRECRACRGPR